MIRLFFMQQKLSDWGNKPEVFIMKQAIILAMVLLFGVSANDANAAKNRSEGLDQILDVPSEPVYRLSAGYVESSPVESHGDVSMFEMDAYWGFAYFWDILFGNVDLALKMNTTFLSSSTGADLPGQFGRIALDAGWTGRFGKGISLQARIFPGIYTDFEELGADSLYLPFSIAMVKTVNSELSGILGAEIRPGFKQEVMPLVGVVWMIDKDARLDARLPESKFSYYLGRGWSAHAGFKWQNMSYAIDENGLGAGQLTVEDFRFFGGVIFRLSDNVQFGGEIGKVTGRSFEYNRTDGGAESDYDVDSATFFRFTLGGPF